MTAAPKVFFSYSLSKTTKPALIKRVISMLKKAVVKRGWKIEDPMEPNIESIRERVENSLWKADAAIIEATTNSPNVMFEAGFARALSSPCLFLINQDIFRDAKLEGYFKFLKLNPDKPLSADLGDIEYLVYPGDLSDHQKWERFMERASKVFDVLQQLLSPEAMLAKRSAREILYQAGAFVSTHSNTHPIIGFVGGRLSMIARGFNLHGPHVFQTEAKHYYESLAAYLTCEPTQSLQVKAIADRSSGVEKFWEKKADPLKTSVAERIFLIDWRVFFQRDQLEDLHQLLQDQTKLEYSVRLGVKGSVAAGEHVLGNEAIGEDLLLVEPDLVGGYLRRPTGNMLRVEKNDQLYREGEERYGTIRKRTFPILSGMTVASLKRAWMELYGIGKWNLQWGEPDTRENSYFENYDQHIRCWIPDYENLVRHCAALTEEAISQRMRQTNTSMRILEIGYGTGELSGQLLSWMNNLNAPVETLHRDPIISAFLGIDSARRMKGIVNEKFPEKRSFQFFDICDAPTWSRTVMQYAPFDVVCGSLVLHDIVSGNVTAKMVNFLEKLSLIMPDNGLALFADVFLSDDDEKKKEQLTQWRKWMKAVGLIQQEINNFFIGNPELIDTLTETKIDSVVNAVGYRRLEFSHIPGSRESSPFKVLILQKLPKN